MVSSLPDFGPLVRRGQHRWPPWATHLWRGILLVGAGAGAALLWKWIR
jgi:hypothetical protein